MQEVRGSIPLGSTKSFLTTGEICGAATGRCCGPSARRVGSPAHRTAAAFTLRHGTQQAPRGGLGGWKGVRGHGCPRCNAEDDDQGAPTPARPIRPGSSTGHGVCGLTPRRHSLPRMGTAPIFFLVLRARDHSPTEMSESLPPPARVLCGAGVFSPDIDTSTPQAPRSVLWSAAAQACCAARSRLGRCGRIHVS